MSNDERQDALYDEMCTEWNELSSDRKVDFLVECYFELDESLQDEFLRETGNP